jgi:mxaK protein
MKSFHVQIVFALVSMACLGLFITVGWELLEARRIARLVSQMPAVESGREPAEVMLARAIYLARAGDMKNAERAYQTVIQQGKPGLRRIAQYNLANLWVRQAMEMTATEVQFLPLMEMAKQQYRDVLAEEPGHWDARYNLERVLWMVPEHDVLQAGNETREPQARTQRPIMLDPGDLP